MMTDSIAAHFWEVLGTLVGEVVVVHFLLPELFTYTTHGVHMAPETVFNVVEVHDTTGMMALAFMSWFWRRSRRLGRLQSKFLWFVSQQRRHIAPAVSVDICSSFVMLRDLVRWPSDARRHVLVPFVEDVLADFGEDLPLFCF